LVFLDIPFVKHSFNDLKKFLLDNKIKFDLETYNKYLHVHGHPPTLGVLSLWVNVISCLQQAVLNKTGVLIFEDDCSFTEKSKIKIEQIVRASKNYDFISFYVRPEEVAEKGRDLLIRPFCNTSTICVYYSMEGAYSILNLLKHYGITAPIDIFLFCSSVNNNELNGALVNPRLGAGVKPLYPMSYSGTAHSPLVNESILN
jgi:hypothetical protein